VSDPQSFDPPVVYSADSGDTWTKYRPAEHATGNNAWLRQQRHPALSIVCTAYGRRHLFGIVHTMVGLEYVKVSGMLPPTGDSPALNSLRLDGAWGEAQVGLCPCGHLHTLDLVKVRDARDRLRWSAPKARVVDVVRVSSPPGAQSVP